MKTMINTITNMLLTLLILLRRTNKIAVYNHIRIFIENLLIPSKPGNCFS